MWQYCKWCETYYNKLGRTCPNCFISFAPGSSSLPDETMQAKLTTLWNTELNFRGSELFIPAIEKGQLKEVISE